jgi:hypothetical protein
MAANQASAEAAYFKVINDDGGINGRKLTLISLDDGYSPPKTVEQTRYLIVYERVAFIFSSLGTPTNQAIRVYLNDNKVPQLFITTGSTLFGDPTHSRSPASNGAARGSSSDRRGEGDQNLPKLGSTSHRAPGPPPRARALLCVREQGRGRR